MEFAMRALMVALFCAVGLMSAAVGQTRIDVDLGKPVAPFAPITNWFGYDESNYTTMPHGRELLRELHDLSPVPVYIRAHHLFTSGDGVPDLKWSSSNVFTLDANGKPVYDFKIIDQIFDAYKKAGVRPMVELGFMPKDLSRKPEPYQVRFSQGDVLASGAQEPPKDYRLWGELVHTFTAHLVARYGAEVTRQWYWEVWNEPDIPYWHGTPQEYFTLYDYAVAAVRAALPGAKVGGPATTGPGGKSGAAYLKAFLEHCAHERSAANGKSIPLDFISFHAKGQPKTVDGHVRMGLDKELIDVREGFRIVASSRFAKLPIILSEADPEGCAACSAKSHPANAYRNGLLYASYTAAAHKGLLDLAQRYHANLISMLSWSFEFENTGYFEGFRSLATNGVDKPVLNVFRMAGLMGGTRVATHSTSAAGLDGILAAVVHGRHRCLGHQEQAAGRHHGVELPRR
jgi:xylan 1,4-beta-xylosidase